tara:strand:+ start:472 stop:846 length:375 start_codon:yes stop_codon:yes gene_type:complete
MKRPIQISWLDLMTLIASFVVVLALCFRYASGVYGVVLALFLSVPILGNFVISIVRINSSILDLAPNIIWVFWVAFRLQDIAEHPDAQAGVDLLFIVVYGTPLLLLAWGVVVGVDFLTTRRWPM